MSEWREASAAEKERIAAAVRHFQSACQTLINRGYAPVEILSGLLTYAVSCAIELGAKPCDLAARVHLEAEINVRMRGRPES